MSHHKIAAAAGVLLLVVATPSYGQEMETLIAHAAEAKAAAGREAQAQGHIEFPVAASVGTFTTFDVPGAGTGSGQGTSPVAINAAGLVTGSYSDTSGVGHGFLRRPNGSIVTFDPPGSTGTAPTAINAEGVIAGNYSDTAGQHSFLRAKDGSFVIFNAPGSTSTVVEAINREGVIAGFFLGANNVVHGVFGSPGGALTKFSVPGAAQFFPGDGTAPADINSGGAIVGSYIDNAKLQSHGFLRTPRGTFLKLDPPPRGYIPYFGPYGFGNSDYIRINSAGLIVGTYFEYIPDNPFGGDYRVFIRYPGGFFITFDAATYGPCCVWSIPTGVNPDGLITGLINDGASIFHGFIRNVDATITTPLDAPGAGTGFDQGTVPLGINPAGLLTGVYIDANNVNHGFLYSPAQ